MTTSISFGSTPLSVSRVSAARTERSDTCSSSAAMCLPRRPNFSTITSSGMPDRSATSAAVIHRSGRYEAVATSPTFLTVCSGAGGAGACAYWSPPSSLRLLGPEDAADEALELDRDAARHRPVPPEDPAHADHLAEPHQCVGGHLRIELRDLARLGGLPQRLDVTGGEAVVVEAQHLRRDELGLPDDPVQRRVLGGEAEVGVEAAQLLLQARLALRGRLFHRAPH